MSLVSSSFAMEPETVREESVRVDVSTPRMSNLPLSVGSKSCVLVDIHEVVEEYKEDESGTTLVRWYTNPDSKNPRSRTIVKPRNFRPNHLSQLLRYQLNRDISFCRNLTKKIVSCQQSRAKYPFNQKPFLMRVNVRVINEIRFVVLPVFFNITSREVFQRLFEEQRVTSFDLGESCSICFEDFIDSSSEIRENHIIQMPNCLRLFHQKCIFTWLAKYDKTCPMCRGVPYEEDQD